MSHSIQKSLICLGVSIYLLIGASFQNAVAEPVVAILELFTSQGCSSCPPADALIQKFAKRDNLVVLSYSVDYWDYLGWKDTHASSDNSLRQRLYAVSRNDESVYTPQVVVNGKHHAVGSDQHAIETLISETQNLPLEVSLTMVGDAIEVNFDGEFPKEVESATIYIASVVSESSVNIKRGENSNREITYTNIVKNLQPIGMLDGKLQKIMFPVNEFSKDDADSCAIIIQAGKKGVPGQILGAALY